MLLSFHLAIDLDSPQKLYPALQYTIPSQSCCPRMSTITFQCQADQAAYLLHLFSTLLKVHHGRYDAYDISLRLPGSTAISATPYHRHHQ